MSAAQGLVSRLRVELLALFLWLAPQPDLGRASALLHLPSLNSSCHCVPSSLFSARLHCGLSSSGVSSDRQAAVTNSSLGPRTHSPSVYLIYLQPPSFDLAHAKQAFYHKALCLFGKFIKNDQVGAGR